MNANDLFYKLGRIIFDEFSEGFGWVLFDDGVKQAVEYREAGIVLGERI